jgi:Flp pilus assembly protein TadG
VGTKNHPAGGRERGSAAVEFVLVLPLVLVMALALVQVGLLVKDQIVVAESARAGARQGAVSTNDQEAVRAAQDAAVSLDTNRLGVAVDREGGIGSAVTVSVVYRASIDIPLVSWLFPASVQLRGVAIMRQETG